jgi:hypothetical protein
MEYTITFLCTHINKFSPIKHYMPSTLIQYPEILFHSHICSSGSPGDVAICWQYFSIPLEWVMPSCGSQYVADPWNF